MAIKTLRIGNIFFPLIIAEMSGNHNQSLDRAVAIVDAAAKAGAHIATIPYRVLLQMIQHPLTDIGIRRFIDDWTKVMGEKKIIDTPTESQDR